MTLTRARRRKVAASESRSINYSHKKQIIDNLPPKCDNRTGNPRGANRSLVKNCKTLAHSAMENERKKRYGKYNRT